MTRSLRYVQPPHRFAAWRLAACLLASLIASGARADVLDYDDRESPTLEERAALAGLGVLFPDGEAGSTAFLVGGCEVLVTAKHVVFDLNDRPRAGRYYYYPRNGPDRIEVPLTGSIHGRGDDMAEDWIVLRLSAPVPGCRPMPVKALGDDELLALSGQFAVAGFQADRDGALMVSRDCGIEPACQQQTRGASVFTHTCDTFEGTSGAPLFVELPQGPVAIGIQLAGAAFEPVDSCDRSNLALRMSDAFYEAISDMTGGAPLDTVWRRRPSDVTQ